MAFLVYLAVLKDSCLIFPKFTFSDLIAHILFFLLPQLVIIDIFCRFLMFVIVLRDSCSAYCFLVDG